MDLLRDANATLSAVSVELSGWSCVSSVLFGFTVTFVFFFCFFFCFDGVLGLAAISKSY